MHGTLDSLLSVKNEIFRFVIKTMKQTRFQKPDFVIFGLTKNCMCLRAASPCLAVIGGDSSSESRGFKSNTMYRMDIFTLIWCKILIFVWKGQKMPVMAHLTNTCVWCQKEAHVEQNCWTLQPDKSNIVAVFETPRLPIFVNNYLLNINCLGWWYAFLKMSFSYYIFTCWVKNCDILKAVGCKRHLFWKLSLIKLYILSKLERQLVFFPLNKPCLSTTQRPKCTFYLNSRTESSFKNKNKFKLANSYPK